MAIAIPELIPRWLMDDYRRDILAYRIMQENAINDFIFKPNDGSVCTAAKENSCIGLKPLKEEKQPMTTLVFYYDNGKTYTAKKVTKFHNYSHSDCISYSTKRKFDNVFEVASYDVSKKDLVAIKVITYDEVKVIKLKPCAKVSVEVGKK